MAEAIESLVKSCKPLTSHGASDDQAIASLFVKSCKPSPSHGASGSISRVLHDSHFRAISPALFSCPFPNLQNRACTVVLAVVQ